MTETSLYKIKAIKEYFTRFVEIKSVDNDGNEVRLVLTKPGENNNNGRWEYCDKVKVGETLDSAISRSLKDDLGLEPISSGYSFDPNDTAKNKYGEILQRVMVQVLVKYRELKDYEVVGLAANWVKTKKVVEFRREEALEWLKKETTSDLAANRFGNKEEGIKFIEKLYKAGAIRVWAEDIKDDFDGEYTDTLVVILPADKEKRLALFKIANKELQNEYPGEQDENDIMQTEITFWWD